MLTVRSQQRLDWSAAHGCERHRSSGAWETGGGYLVAEPDRRVYFYRVSILDLTPLNAVHARLRVAPDVRGDVCAQICVVAQLSCHRNTTTGCSGSTRFLRPI